MALPEGFLLFAKVARQVAVEAAEEAAKEAAKEAAVLRLGEPVGENSWAVSLIDGELSLLGKRTLSQRARAHQKFVRVQCRSSNI